MDRVIYTRTYKNGVRACDRLDKLRIKYGSGDNAVRVATQIRGHLASPFDVVFLSKRALETARKYYHLRSSADLDAAEEIRAAERADRQPFLLWAGKCL